MEMRCVAVLPPIAVLLLAAGLAVPAPALCAAAGKKTGTHGAIAVNRDSAAVGYAYDFKSARDAKREALARCGEKRCEVVASFHGGCAAVARDGKRLATATGATRDEAETKAARKCGRDCAVAAWACTKDK
jgi:hypothetical protein